MNHKYNHILQSTTLLKQSTAALSAGNIGCRIFLTNDESFSTIYEPGLYFVDTTNTPFSFHKVDFNNSYPDDPSHGDEASYVAQTRFYNTLTRDKFNGFCAASYADFEKIFNTKITSYIQDGNMTWFCTKAFSIDKTEYEEGKFYDCSYADSHWVPTTEESSLTPSLSDVIFTEFSHFITDDLNEVVPYIETESDKFIYLSTTCVISTPIYTKGWYEVAEDEENPGNYYWKKIIEGGSGGAGTIIGYYDSETDKFYKDASFIEVLETEVGSICVDITNEGKPIEYVCYDKGLGVLGYRLENYTRHKEVSAGSEVNINNADLLQGNTADAFVKKNNAIHKYIKYEYEDSFIDEIDHMGWED